MKKADPAVTYQDILNASTRLKGFCHRTPVFTSSQANEKTGARLFFKCENFQRIGAFKFRGAYNAISQLSDTQKEQGIVAFSSGNHAQAVALAARLLNVPATIVMPMDAPSVKLAATRGYGAKIILYDRNKASREEIAQNLMNQYGLALIPPYDHPDIIAGQGTAAKELFEEVGELDYLFVPVGGGGLISGSAISAAYLSPPCKVIGVEPETGNDAQQSLRTKKIVKITVPNTIADGAQTQFVGQLVLPIMIQYVKDIVTVSDNQLREQMRFFAERMKIIVEPTGCLGAAAVFNKIVDVQGARVGVILSGGNVDMNKFCDYVRNVP
ncbi:MAG: threo-3-hydroxy-L-aspartate ammonia-lyase [Proteobacteria bacterium]|nr:threo-3-hydroxy-L-aspartate ammonia-lyase [Pseudomonadota bacterium]